MPAAKTPATKSPIAEIFGIPALAAVSDLVDDTGAFAPNDHTVEREAGVSKKRLYTTAEEAKQFFNLLFGVYCDAIGYLRAEDVRIGAEIAALRTALPKLEPGKRAMLARILDTAESAGEFVSTQGELARRDYTTAVEIQSQLVHSCASPDVFTVSADGFAHVFKIFLKALAWNFAANYFAFNAAGGSATLNYPHIYAAFVGLTVFTRTPFPEKLHRYIDASITRRARAPRGKGKGKGKGKKAADGAAASDAEAGDAAADAASAASAASDAEAGDAPADAADAADAASTADTISTVADAREDPGKAGPPRVSSAPAPALEA